MRWSCPLIILVSLHWTLSSSSTSLILGSPEPDTVLQVWPHQCQGEKKDYLPALLSNRVILPQGQASAIPLVELHEVAVSPFLQLMEVSLGGSTTCWCISINHSSSFVSSADVLRVHSDCYGFSWDKVKHNTAPDQHPGHG